MLNRYIPIFIKLSNAERKIFFKNLKAKTSISWERFYPQYNLSRSIFFDYLSGCYNIPKQLFKQWCLNYNINTNKGEEIIRPKYTKNSIPQIKLTTELAEILGAINGDGHISKYKYEVCIVCDAKEKEYLCYLKKVLEKISKIKFSFFYMPSAIKLRCYSKDFSNFLVKEYCLPIGKKKGKLKIPPEIKKDKKFLISYLRGLFDTDGTIYQRRGKDMVIGYSSADSRFLAEISEVLKGLGFQNYKGRKHICIYDQKLMGKIFNTIKPANSKHLKKFEIYQNNAWVV